MTHDWDPRRLTTSEDTPRAFGLVLVFAYVIITAVVAAHHEPWRDEADAWLYVRDGNLASIFDWSRHAGTPTLWYFVLAPLAHFGLPYASQQVLNLLMATAAVALLVARAPLTRLTKTLAVLSYYLSYEYAVIARSYALAILLIMLAAVMSGRRNERPIAFAVVVFLLFNVNAQGFFIAGAFAALFVVERMASRALRGRALGAAMIMAAGALASWLQVRTPSDPARRAPWYFFNAEALPWSLGNAFLPALPVWLGCAAGVLILGLVTLALRRSRDAILLLWISSLALGALYANVWIGGLRHAGFFLVLTLAAIWIGARDIDVRPAAAAALLLNGVLLISVFVASRYWILDIRENFSGAKEMATYIREHDLTRYDIAAHNLTQCEALLPYLPGSRFWYAGLGEHGTYLKWDAAQERALEMPYPVAEQRAEEHFAGTPLDFSGSPLVTVQ